MKKPLLNLACLVAFAAILVVSGCVGMSDGASSSAREGDGESATRVVPAVDQREADTGAVQVQWLFAPNEAERAQLTPMLQQIADGQGGSGPLIGQLHRFTLDSAPGRYLLVAIVGDGVASDVALYAIHGSSHSPPYQLGVREPGDAFADVGVAEYDSDGEADFGYCHYPNGQRTVGRPHAIGYRGGGWYRITTPRRALPDCPASGT